MSGICEQTRAAIWRSALEREEALSAEQCTHLEGCDLCRRAVDEAEQTVADFRGLDAAELSADAERRLRLALQPVMDEVARDLGRPRRWRWTWRSLALAGVAAAGLVVLVLWPEPARKVAGLAVMESGEVELPARLEAGAVIAAGADSGAGIEIGAARVFLAENSRLRLIETTSAETRLGLDSGTVVVRLDPTTDRQGLSVETSFGQVAVTGTVFSVSLDDGGTVETARGSVEVSLAAEPEPRRVGAGQALRVSKGAAEPMTAERRRALGALFDVPWHATSATGTVEFVGKPAAARLEIDGQPVGRAPFLARWPVGEHSYRVHTRRREETGTFSVRPEETTRIDFRLPPARAGARPALPDEVDDDELRAAIEARDCAVLRARARDLSVPAAAARGWALVAECHLARDEKEEALEVYASIASRFASTSAAGNALFEVGRLSAPLGRQSQALGAFRDYLKRYPKGPLAEDAHFRACSLELDLGNHERAATCMARHRRRFPRGRHVGPALLVEARVRRSLNDCATAARLLRDYLARGEPDERERSAFWRIECLRRLHDPELGAAIDAHLREFPDGREAKTLKRWRGELP